MTSLWWVVINFYSQTFIGWALGKVDLARLTGTSNKDKIFLIRDKIFLTGTAKTIKGSGVQYQKTASQRSSIILKLDMYYKMLYEVSTNCISQFSPVGKF